MSAMGWVVSGGTESGLLEAELAARVQSRLDAGVYQESALAHMRERRLALVDRTLHLDDTHLDAIRRVAAAWDIQLTPPKISSHRPFVGPFIVAVKKFLFPLLAILLKDFMRKEREYRAAVLDALIVIASDSKDQGHDNVARRDLPHR